jgi:hypothetical protein
MTIETIPQDRQAKLFMAIEKNMNSVKRRNVGYTIYCYSDFIATVTLTISGRRGSVQKAIAVNFDISVESWVVYADSKKYTLGSLSELQAIMKSIIARQTNTITRI